MAPPKKPTPKRSMPAPAAMGQNRSIDIRRISNGHIIRESSSDKNGNYNSKETFSPTPPTIQMNTQKIAQKMQSAMPKSTQKSAPKPRGK